MKSALTPTRCTRRKYRQHSSTCWIGRIAKQIRSFGRLGSRIVRDRITKALKTVEGKGTGEYCAWLAQTVESFANWSDPRQACILVNAAQITYPSPSTDAAARARAAMPCLLQMSASDLTINRAIAIPMLAEAMEKAKGTLDERTTQTAKEIMLSDLRDPNVGLRASAIDALRQFGTSDMIPALEEVAAKDPAPGVDGETIRKSAAEAILEIRKRATKQQR